MRGLVAAVVIVLAAAGCARNPSLPDDPADVLEAAIGATEQTKALRFTIDGQGSVRVPDKPPEDLFFGATGNLQFPSRVHMTMNIDRPDARGVRQELIYIDRILYVRPAGSDGQWQRTSQQVQIPGFDPLTAFDLETFSSTSEVKDGGSEDFEGSPTQRLRIVPTEEFRAKAQSQLPAEFKQTKLAIVTHMWVDERTKHIRRVLQRFDYTGDTTGFFESDMRFSEFGLDLQIAQPDPSQVSDAPVQVPAPQGR